jgi:acyl dehydratase
VTSAAHSFSSDDLAAFDGPREIGIGEWRPVDQARIDAFAAATGDRQWIHVDPERAKSTPFGGTIAHGFLTLSLLPSLVGEIVAVAGTARALNLGLRSVRFPAIVPAGGSIRARLRFLEAERARDGGLDVVWRVEIECRGQLRPSCIAEWIVRYYS